MKNGIIISITFAIWWVIKMFFKLLKTIIEFLSIVIVFLGLYFPLFYVVFGIILLATTSFSFGGTGTDQILYYIGLGLCCIASIMISVSNALVKPIASLLEPFRAYREEVRRSRSERRGDGRYEDDYDGEAGEDRRDHRSPSDRRFNEYDRDYRGNAEYREDREPYYRRDPSGEGEYRSPYSRDDYAPDRYAASSDYSYGSGNRWGDEQDRPRFDYEEGPRFAQPREPYYVERRDYSGYAPREEQEPSSPRELQRERYSAPMPREPMPERPLIYYSKRRPGVLVKEYSDRFELYQEDSRGCRYIGTEYKDD